MLSPTQKYGVIPQALYDEISGMNSVKLKENTDFNFLKTCHKGDFCISLRSFQGGFEYSKYEGIVSPAYYVYEFITENYDKRYFHHLMRNRILADEFRRISGGIREGQWDLDREQFENMYLPVPPKSEQIAIADFIDSKYGNIEKSVELKKQQLEKLEEYKKSLIFEYVTGKREVSCEFPSETSEKKGI